MENCATMKKDTNNEKKSVVRFLDEIRQQPDALRQVIKQAFAEEELCDSLINMIRTRKNPHIVLTGMGSSLFACNVAKNFLGNHGFKSSTYESYELLMMDKSFFDTDTIVVAVSQSGESLEVLQLLEKLQPDVPVIGVVNYPNSKLYKMADIPCPIYAGTEYLTSTKTYTNTLATILLLSGYLAGCNKVEIAELREQMEICANKMETIISDEELGEKISDFISSIKFLTCVGSGYSYTTASHSEIVAEEAGKFFASRFTTAQFIHGPIELIGEGFGTLIYDFDRKYSNKCDDVCESVLQYGGKVLLITNRTDVKSRENLMVYVIDHEDPVTSILLEIIPMELGIDSLCKSRNVAAGQLSRVVKRLAL